MKDLTKRLWESDEASALTNEAAREIEKLREALEPLIHYINMRDLRMPVRAGGLGDEIHAIELGSEYEAILKCEHLRELKKFL